MTTLACIALSVASDEIPVVMAPSKKIPQPPELPSPPVRAVLHAGVADEGAGEAYIPQHTNFIVAANHSSHLDMGALKVALGDAGHELASLAAADYFFKNKWRRAYFKNLTNLVPMERSGSIRKSLGIAEKVLRTGKSLVLFPEGTRSRTGEMVDFLPSLGYLALHADVGVLPAYIEGAHAAMPVGATIPKKRDLGVYFGPFLTIDFLREITHGMSHQEAWRLCSALTQRIIENLRDGITPRFDAESVRAAWDSARLGTLVPPPFKSRIKKSAGRIA